jgi:hypothetical protein
MRVIGKGALEFQNDEGPQVKTDENADEKTKFKALSPLSAFHLSFICGFSLPIT